MPVRGQDMRQSPLLHHHKRDAVRQTPLFVHTRAIESNSAIQQRGICYIYNDKLGGKSADTLPDPSRVWLLMDMNVVTGEVPPAHNGGCYVLFVDGHVKWYPASQLPKFQVQTGQ